MSSLPNSHSSGGGGGSNGGAFGRAANPPFRFPTSPPHFDSAPPPPDELRRIREVKAPTPPPAAESGGLGLHTSVQMTASLAQMSLENSPPPGKIRRRNALPTSDLFLQSRQLQRLQDLNQTAEMGALHQELADLSLQRPRKKAVPNHKAAAKAMHAGRRAAPAGPAHKGPLSPPPTAATPPVASTDAKSKALPVRISLHQDLQSFKPHTRSLVTADEPTEQMLCDTRRGLSQAVVPYKPPRSLLEDIVSKAGLDDVDMDSGGDKACS